MKKTLAKPIALYATPEEIRKFELVKAYHNRSSNSDMLRVLIENELKKILNINNADASTQQGGTGA